jgi:hypothetical protein
MTALPVRRVVLYKHGVGYFEREGSVENDAILTLTFKQSEVSDVLKSLGRNRSSSYWQPIDSARVASTGGWLSGPPEARHSEAAAM